MQQLQRITLLLSLAFYGCVQEKIVHLEQSPSRISPPSTTEPSTTEVDPPSRIERSLNLRASEIADTAFTLQWDQIDEAMTYQVQVDGQQVASLEASESPLHRIENLGPGSVKAIMIVVFGEDGSTPLLESEVLQVTLSQIPQMPEPQSANYKDSAYVVQVKAHSDTYRIQLYGDPACLVEVGAPAEVSNKLASISFSASEVATVSSFYARSLNELQNASPCSTAFATKEDFSCPEQFIRVPANSEIGTEEFCVMKNEAGYSNPLNTNLWIFSHPKEAKTKCRSLGENYDLISNPEWMAIARSIELEARNWSGGAVGSGQLGRGISSYGFNGIPDRSAFKDNSDLSRRHFLGNGEEIFDFAGNLWEWVDWTPGGELDFPSINCPVQGWQSLTAVSCESLSPKDYAPKNPNSIYGATVTHQLGLGMIRLEYDPVPNMAIQRGGDKKSISMGGIYSMILDPSYGQWPYVNSNSRSFGFRCVFRP